MEYMTLILLFLKTFVMALVSLRQLVNLAHSVFSEEGSCLLEFRVDGRKGVLYPLLCRICCIVFSSFSLLSGVRW